VRGGWGGGGGGGGVRGGCVLAAHLKNAKTGIAKEGGGAVRSRGQGSSRVLVLREKSEKGQKPTWYRVVGKLP